MRTICGRDSPKPSRGAKREGFSEEPQENPLETGVWKIQADLWPASFSTNSQGSSQQQEAIFSKFILWEPLRV